MAKPKTAHSQTDKPQTKKPHTDKAQSNRSKPGKRPIEATTKKRRSTKKAQTLSANRKSTAFDLGQLKNKLANLLVDFRLAIFKLANDKSIKLKSINPKQNKPATGKSSNSSSAASNKNAASKAKTSLVQQKLSAYARLARLDRPIGIYLVLWPTLWALWLAADGLPDWHLLVIFCLGVVLMRSAGCIINDFADRKVDGHVKRTKNRPIVTGQVSAKEALIVFGVLCLIAFILVLFTNSLTVYLSFGALALAACYPFMKRYTHLPQVVLGAAFAWSIPMAFAAQTGELTSAIWVLYTAVVLWTVAYDTFYAMVDREDDIKIGIKSTAVLFGEQDKFMTATLQGMTLFSLYLVGGRFELGVFYYLGLAVAAGLFVWQQMQIKEREPQACMKAFLQNNWVGAAIFAGIFLDKL